MKQEKVVLVAPYCPGGAAMHLGAAKKIELVAGLLGRLGFEVHLVDSSHSSAAFDAAVFGVAATLGAQDITLWRPFCVPSRKLGKLLNIFFSFRLFRRLSDIQPALVWIYNSYAFEARLSMYLRRRVGCKLVLELEDMPQARGRGLNPKPLLDQRYFHQLLTKADLVTFVNAALAARYARQVNRTLLFPSILQQALTTPVPRIRFASDALRLGYFGGLEQDKGAGLLLDLLPQLPANWTIVVTGAGSLEKNFQDAQRAFPSRLEFHGRVEPNRMIDLMQSCDSIANPHASISAMHDGVFPFKVCEAIASGALLISTPLPSIDLDLSRSVLFFDGSVAGLARALADAKRMHDDNRAEMQRVREALCARYGEEAVLRQLQAAIGSLIETRESPSLRGDYATTGSDIR